VPEINYMHANKMYTWPQQLPVVLCNSTQNIKYVAGSSNGTQQNAELVQT